MPVDAADARPPIPAPAESQQRRSDRQSHKSRVKQYRDRQRKSQYFYDQKAAHCEAGRVETDRIGMRVVAQVRTWTTTP